MFKDESDHAVHERRSPASQSPGFPPSFPLQARTTAREKTFAAPAPATAATNALPPPEPAGPRPVDGGEYIPAPAHLLNHIGQAVIATDLSGTITYANHFAEELLGWTAAELRGRNLVTVTSPSSAREGTEQLMARLREGRAWSGEVLIQHRDGRKFPAFITNAPLRDAHGQLTGAIGIAKNITERKIEEERLLTSENRLHELCNIMSRGDLGFEAKIRELLLAGCRQLRLSTGLVARVEGERCTVEHTVSATRAAPVGVTGPLLASLCHPLLERGEPLAVEPGATPGKEQFDPPLQACVGTPLRVAGRAYGALCFTDPEPRGEKFAAADLEFVRLIGQWIEGAVERHEWWTALQESQRRLEVAVQTNQQLLDHSLDLICNIDAEGRFTRLSAACERILGYAPDEMVGRAFLDFVHPDDHAATRLASAALAEGKDVHEHENRYLRKDGALVYLSWSGTPSKDDQSTFCVARDCSERKRTEEAHAARQIAEQANVAKSEFLSRMSHELRTPMNAILGFAQVLDTEAGLNADQQDSVRQILRGGSHLLQLINEVLDLSSIEAGRMTLSLEVISLPGLIEETVDLLRPMGREFKVRLAAPPGDGPGGHVIADRQRLKQVLLNLLGNAIKYNRPGGAATVSYAFVAATGMTHLAVSDTGAGISAGNLARLFNPFERLGAEQTHVEGTGLGLALSKRLVEHMGGSIGVESLVGEGTTFWIDLPVATGAPVAEVSPEQPAAECPAALPAPPGEPGGDSAPTHTVLYIEDNPPNVRLVTRILARRPSVRLLCAKTGSLGLQMAREHLPDLILLDLHLPDAHGSQIIKWLAADPRTASIPVVMLTADVVTARRGELLEAGARAFLTKPLEVRSFLAMIDQFIGNPA